MAANDSSFLEGLTALVSSGKKGKKEKNTELDQVLKDLDTIRKSTTDSYDFFTTTLLKTITTTVEDIQQAQNGGNSNKELDASALIDEYFKRTDENNKTLKLNAKKIDLKTGKSAMTPFAVMINMLEDFFKSSSKNNEKLLSAFDMTEISSALLESNDLLKQISLSMPEAFNVEDSSKPQNMLAPQNGVQVHDAELDLQSLKPITAVVTDTAEQFTEVLKATDALDEDSTELVTTRFSGMFEAFDKVIDSLEASEQRSGNLEVAGKSYFGALGAFIKSYSEFYDQEFDTIAQIDMHSDTNESLLKSIEGVSKLLEVMTKVGTSNPLAAAVKARLACSSLKSWIKQISKVGLTISKSKGDLKQIETSLAPITEATKAFSIIENMIEGGVAKSWKLSLKAKFINFGFVKTWLKKAKKVLKLFSDVEEAKDVSTAVSSVTAITEAIDQSTDTINKSFFKTLLNNILWSEKTDHFKGMRVFLKQAITLGKELPEKDELQDAIDSFDRGQKTVAIIDKFNTDLLAKGTKIVILSSAIKAIEKAVTKGLENSRDFLNGVADIFDKLDDLDPKTVANATASIFMLSPFFTAVFVSSKLARLAVDIGELDFSQTENFIDSSSQLVYQTCDAFDSTSLLTGIGLTSLLSVFFVTVSMVETVALAAGIMAIPTALAMKPLTSALTAIGEAAYALSAITPVVAALALATTAILLPTFVLLIPTMLLANVVALLSVVPSLLASTMLTGVMAVGATALAVGVLPIPLLALALLNSVLLAVIMPLLAVVFAESIVAGLLSFLALPLAAPMGGAVAAIGAVAAGAGLLPLPLLALAIINTALLAIEMPLLAVVFAEAAVAGLLSIPAALFGDFMVEAAWAVGKVGLILGLQNPVILALGVLNTILLSVMLATFVPCVALLVVAGALGLAARLLQVDFSLWYISQCLSDLALRLTLMLPTLPGAIVSLTLWIVATALLAFVMTELIAIGLLAVAGVAALASLGIFMAAWGLFSGASLLAIPSLIPTAIFAAGLWGVATLLKKAMTSIVELGEMVNQHDQKYWRTTFDSIGLIFKGMHESFNSIGLLGAIGDGIKGFFSGNGFESMVEALKVLNGINVPKIKNDVAELGPIIGALRDIDVDSFDEDTYEDFEDAMEALNKSMKPLTTVCTQLKVVDNMMGSLGQNFSLDKFRNFFFQFQNLDKNDIEGFKKAGKNLKAALKEMPLDELNEFTDAYSKLGGKLNISTESISQLNSLDGTADSVNNLSASFGDLNSQLNELSKNEETLEMLRELTGSKSSKGSGLGGLISGIFNHDSKQSSSAPVATSVPTFQGTKTLDDIWALLDQINQKMAVQEMASWQQ